MSFSSGAPLLLIFDLDGTLVDSREDIARACNHALVTHGRTTLPRSTIETFVGDGARYLVARAFDLPIESHEVDAPLESFHAFYVAHACDATTILPGVMNALSDLASKARLAVCTNKPRSTTLSVLATLQLQAFFPVIYAGGDGPLKPDPTGIHACCNYFDVTPNRAWMVGDGPQDILAGKNAGVRTVGIATGLFVSRDVLAKSAPDDLVSGFDELLKLLG